MNAKLCGPSGVFVSNGEVFIVDACNYRVRKLLRNGQITTIAGVADLRNQSEAMELNCPYSVVVSSSYQVYISEWFGHRIKKIDQCGVISTIAGTGKRGFDGDGQLAVNALLNCPCGLFVTDDEEVLFADSVNNRVRKIDRNGVMSTIAGNGEIEYNRDNLLATSAYINIPTSVFQYKQEIYIVDAANYCVRKIDRNGIISTVAGSGKQGYNGDEILATKSNMNPQCLFVHNDCIYISDRNNRIRKVLPNGMITTIAGTGEKGFNGDGQLAIKAHLNFPTGIFVDVDLQIYIADQDNHCIRKIDQHGMISTIAGTPGESGYSGDVPFDFEKYPHLGPRKKSKIKPFPKAYHDIVIHCNDSTTWTEYEPLFKKTKLNNQQH